MSRPPQVAWPVHYAALFQVQSTARRIAESRVQKSRWRKRRPDPAPTGAPRNLRLRFRPPPIAAALRWAIARGTHMDEANALRIVRQKQRLARALYAISDNSHVFVLNLKAVADRAHAQEARAKGFLRTASGGSTSLTPEASSMVAALNSSPFPNRAAKPPSASCKSVTTLWRRVAPKRSAWRCILSSRSGPLMPSGNPGWLRVSGMYPARLSPSCMTRNRRLKRPR